LEATTVSKNYGVRLSADQEKLVSVLAEAIGQQETTVIRRLVPEGPWGDVFRDFARLANEPNVLTVPVKLMAEGLKRVIQQSHKPIESTYLDLMPPQFIAELYLEWADALCTEAKLAGPLGNRFKFRKGEHGFLPVRA
jgi:hypothetical protein